MLISHRKKFIYTKTVKTAGTSVELFFEKYCFADREWKFSHARDEYSSASGIVGYRGADKGSSTFYNHMPAEELKNLLGKQIWDNYHKFTVIRNPFDKMVSAFYHFEKKNKADKYLADGKSDTQRFREWVLGGGEIIDRSAYMIDGEIVRHKAEDYQ